MAKTYFLSQQRERERERAKGREETTKESFCQIFVESSKGKEELISSPFEVRIKIETIY